MARVAEGVCNLSMLEAARADTLLNYNYRLIESGLICSLITEQWYRERQSIKLINSLVTSKYLIAACNRDTLHTHGAHVKKEHAAINNIENLQFRTNCSASIY